MNHYVVGVVFDDTEIASIAGDAKANSNEMRELPGGIIGFKLDYFQVSCWSLMTKKILSITF